MPYCALFFCKIRFPSKSIARSKASVLVHSQVLERTSLYTSGDYCIQKECTFFKECWVLWCPLYLFVQKKTNHQLDFLLKKKGESAYRILTGISCLQVAVHLLERCPVLCKHISKHIVNVLLFPSKVGKRQKVLLKGVPPK